MASPSVFFSGTSLPKHFVPRGSRREGEVPFAAEMGAVLHEERLDHGCKSRHALPSSVAIAEIGELGIFCVGLKNSEFGGGDLTPAQIG